MTGERTEASVAGVAQGAVRRARGALRGTRNQVLVAAGLAVAVAAFLTVAAVGHNFFDLRVYTGALTHWARGGGELYDWLNRDTTYGFTYPPFAALLMLPLAYLPFWLSVALSVTTSAAAATVLLWWLVDPVARRMGWTRWFALAVAVCLAAAFEPMRETVDFGQVNTLLLVLVAADLLLLVGPGYAAPDGRGRARYRRLAGIGVGLATAVKLTPGIFIVYLVVTGRWRAAATAVGTAAAATVLAGALAPNASREFWTAALWDTDRVGQLAFISNQSLRGMVARFDPAQPSTLAWLALVLAAVLWWAWRVRRAVAVRDEATGLALTGVLGCLVSPVTWVHHLVWLLPALVLLVDHALLAPAGSRRRRGLLAFAALAYGLLVSRLVWIWQDDYALGPLGYLGSNAYVWVSVALLLALPVRDRSGLAQLGGVPHLDQPERRPAAGTLEFVRRPLTVGD